MNIKRFLKSIAGTSLAMGALSVSGVAGADEFPCHPFGGDCCNPQHCCEPAPTCGWGYNPPAYLRCGGGGSDFWDGLGVRVDFLWWRASEDALLFGYENEINQFNVTSSETFSARNEQHNKYFNTRYDPGFRLGLNHYCQCDCWDSALNWTHFHTKATAKGHSDGLDDVTDPNAAGAHFTVFVPAWERVTSIVAGVYPEESKGHWSLNLDLLDLEFGYKYFVSSCFSLRPNLGLRGARIYQTVRTRSYTNRLANDFFGPNDFVSFTHSKSDFLGLGPRVGLDLKLDLGCGFAVVGQAAGSILFGRLDRNSKEEYIQATEVGTTDVYAEGNLTYIEKSKSSRHSRAVTDLAVGFEWDHCVEWCNRSHPVSVAFLWEHHVFYDFADFSFTAAGYNLDDDAWPASAYGLSKSASNLYTQGLTVALNFGF